MSGMEDGDPRPICEKFDRGSIPTGGSEEQELTDGLSEFENQAHKLFDLSSEMTHLLSELSRKVKCASDQLQALRADINQKKLDLKVLYQIEASAISLNQLAEEHRTQKEKLEHLIAEQQTNWEEEKEKLLREQKEYLENISAARRREDEEYQRVRQSEQLAARHKFEEELRILRQEEADRQSVLEKELLQRAQILQTKEKDAARLIHELEQFMTRFVLRNKLQGAISRDLYAGTNVYPVDPAAVHQNSSEKEPLSQSSAPILTSVNEMLLALNKKNEALKDEFEKKLEAPLIQFSVNKQLSQSEDSENIKQ